MKHSKTLETEIAGIRAKIAPLSQELTRLTSLQRHALSTEFIEANQITRDQVQFSEMVGQYFCHANDFVEWMKKTQCTKRWAEWNGRIYHTIDLMGGRMPDMPGFAEDLPK